MNHSPDLTSPAPADTYAGDVPRPAEPPQIGPNTQAAADSPAATAPRSWWARLWRNLGRDAGLVAPSLVISVIAAPVLVVLFSVSIATVIVWVGVLLLPLTLTVARAFGNLSRARARAWGAPITEAAPRPRGRGLRWWLAPLSDARAWLICSSKPCSPCRSGCSRSPSPLPGSQAAWAGPRSSSGAGSCPKTAGTLSTGSSRG